MSALLSIATTVTMLLYAIAMAFALVRLLRGPRAQDRVLASDFVIHFTASDGTLALHTWLVVIVLSITAPVTTIVLARAALFRQRRAGAMVPSGLAGMNEQRS
jgi:multisubunit Na+/H+ antiporter MnhF subunit